MLASTACPGCRTEYFQLGRLLSHLDRTPACWEHVMTLPPQSDDVVQRLAAVERQAIRANQRAGRHRWHGKAAQRAGEADDAAV